MLNLRFRSGAHLFRMNPLYPQSATPGLVLVCLMPFFLLFSISVAEPRFVVSYLQTLRSSEESLREQLEKAKKKEAAFIVTFAKREQEIAELKSAVRDLRAQLKPPSMQARRLLLDPAIHEEFTRLKNLVEEKDKKVKELQDNINAVSFTSQSKMGKMIMAKCRTLQEENEEIGNQANEGKIHELGMKLALQKSQNAELRSQFEGLFKQMDKLAGDVDRSNELAVIMQEKLEEKENEIQRLKHDMEKNNSLVEEEQTVLAVAATDSVEGGDAIVDEVTPIKVKTEIESQLD
ncbi:PREDICTED: FKBP12-interacting protein of 37 kDa-like isoform X2 [Erythranthe guttata]|uniref:FKBP12-interacting protein of 37 kDa-like isoform X2 n=1 Tax=Erythranthe guttata TaxID=4155 RepID=UPI00064D9A44|nr:PREDICTED: FKBP12-interacting protein of 37 kDa-like isoform X2 [Erythranthe guttata]|eukprot:XP_012855620.1 PREDICTED: FKBP12-interacting protein of 37 kDa-like isoform X2 [Erythranthe guttata]